MSELKNLDLLPPSIRLTVARYCQSMIQIHQENLKSATVYGSAAGEDYIPERSNINLLFIFADLPFSTLKDSLKVIARGRKEKIPAPLFLTEEHILSSCDTFPIEFIEIKEQHVTVYGEDIFQKLSINQSNLRLQCEQEIKGKLIRIRQSYLEIGLQQKPIEQLLVHSLTALMPVLRSLIRLQGGAPPKSREGVIKEIADRLKLQTEVFMRVLHLKEGRRSGVKKPELESLLNAYLCSLHELAQKVDALPVIS
ncbi:MAG: hypothetical protein K6U11_11060 [bacterium]|nr:hypothetical protein [bacterium]